MTIWSLLGTCNWHCLVRRDDRHYEPGVLDLRSPAPHATLLTRAVHCQARGEDVDYPALDTPGWWRRPERLIYPPIPHRDDAAYTDAQQMPSFSLRSTAARPRPLLITGRRVMPGRAFDRLCSLRDLLLPDLENAVIRFASAV